MVYRVEKSYVDKLVARNPLHFNLLSTSLEFFTDQNQFLFEVSYTVSQYRMARDLIAVRQEVNNLEKFSGSTRTRVSNKSSFVRSFVKLR